MIIYKILNKINGKCYIGQTVNSLNRRISKHMKATSGCCAIRNAIQKYGIDSFIIEEIDSASSLEELNIKEQFWINKINSLWPNGYNLNTGGLNKKYSDESRSKMSKSHKGKKLSQEHKNKILQSTFFSRMKNPEPFKKGAKAMQEWYKNELLNGRHPKRGKKISEEAKKRISEAKMGNKNPMFGKTISEKQKEAIRNGQNKRINNLPSILCHQNGKVYRLVKDAAKDLGIARSSISNVLIGFRKSCKGYTFEYVESNNE